MHTVKLKIEDDIYQNIMFLLNNLNLKGLEIKEEKVENSTNTKYKIQQLFKAKKINVFASIDDPLAWQDQQRDEW
ncbi:conserved hypothetical protein [Bathymodiolus platifrons methanotrophic gill symbiont]|uniref:hypothetical protein n=1 Tax=Bathymodiolus platifrons methanotrophic gill symbiont TaxID=113268 RepID=UPI000B40E242|nr:hypothetical protein [Bathymodiolus platifrons methanotrophic gill symbiont]TXK96129.1 hypothetical protein BMR10_08410 [Methylococcaceae bacterium CS4]TXK97792.1 hypothetical protein BMR11_09690 [Methylococcaceae bacterium CS5]TXL05767.1 hypothetical protein BMR07_08695 [Methylococcaceae bacterium CS1]TXL08120.1 hypothetical protein BMR09_03680 [Methylococcaceae bacterium CS3]TXL10311.1 hypothetical protein BMR08_09940 [Methylococcaceae bacterium CS2]TXL12929.1 hypothetical protein BMR05_